VYLCVAFGKVHVLKHIAKVAQLVEHDLAKVGVAGSNPVFRSTFFTNFGVYARVVELVDTQDLKSCDHYGRAGSIPAPGTLFSFIFFSN
jgi:hypothetical protein